MAKLTNAGNYGIVSDHIGTPVEAFDAKGERVWSAELDIYGRVKEFTGAENFIPFRYQGQYADLETGLYYNRFRYYDPAMGQYTQQDPIGLAGGNPTLYGYVSDSNIWIDIFGLDVLDALFRMRVQIQTRNTNIVSQAITSGKAITALELEQGMMKMIDMLPATGRSDLVSNAHGAASDISKQVRGSIVENGGISQGGNVMRRDISVKNGEQVRFDVENNSGTNLIKCK
jgi:RHS repeat-associated protein